MIANDFPFTITIPWQRRFGHCIVLCICTLLLVACQRPFGETTVTITDDTLYQRFRSPNGAWELVLLAEAGWAFAPHTITVLRRATDAPPTEGQLITRFELYNDGANLNDSNCTVRWRTEAAQEQATLTCNGQEQEAKSYELDLTTGKLLSTTDPNLP